MYLLDYVIKTGFLIVLGALIGLIAGLLLWYSSHVKSPKRIMLAKQILWFGNVTLMLIVTAIIIGLGLEFIPLGWLDVSLGDLSNIKLVTAVILMTLATFLTVHPHFYDDYYTKKLR